MKKIFFLLLLGIFIFLPTGKAFAHWEYIYGYPYWVYDPPAAPKTTGNWKFLPNNDRTYDILFNWTDSLTRRYSLAISKYAGVDPGPNSDTYARVWIFHNITPGRWYINEKFEVNGQWSQAVYWTVDVPEWVAPTTVPIADTNSSIRQQNFFQTPEMIKIISQLSSLIEFGTILFIFYSIFGLANSKSRGTTSEKRKLLIVSLLTLIIVFFGSSYLTTPQNQRCSRSSPYPMQPEFQRAISLIGQRFSEAFGQSNDPRGSVYNCLDIQYQSLSEGLEGAFIFDKSSTSDDLKILVNKNYQANDEILTSLLLAHEITHAIQFVDSSRLSCVNKEAEAFQNELNLMLILNTEEKNSLISRITLNPNSNESYLGVLNLLEFTKSSKNIDETRTLIQYMVSSDPYYQQECGITPTPTYAP